MSTVDLSELLIDEKQFVEICGLFNTKLCIEIYRNGIEYGLNNNFREIFSNFSKLYDVHLQLLNDLNQLSSSSHNMSCISSIFSDYISDFLQIDIKLMENIYLHIEDIFNLSYNNFICDIVTKLNYFDNKFNNNNEEEPQFLSFIFYLTFRLHKYINYYKISCLVSNRKITSACCSLYCKTDTSLYLLCIQQQLGPHCPIPIYCRNRSLIRLEKLNMRAGKLRKKQKKRLLILFNDRILWCSILSQITKKGQKYKYKGSYEINQDKEFKIKSFYNDNNGDIDRDIDISNTDDDIQHQQFSKSYGNLLYNNDIEQFGFKFGKSGNQKSYKIVICSENQQQKWCKDINKILNNYDTKNDFKFENHFNYSESIDLLERFLKHSTNWNQKKIWKKLKIYNQNKGNKSLLNTIISIFDDILKYKLINKLQFQSPPPVPVPVPVPITIPIKLGDDDDDDNDNDDDGDDNIIINSKEHSVSAISISNNSHRSSLNEFSEFNESNKLIEELNNKLIELQKKYEILENDNANLSARNAFLNNRWLSFQKNNLFIKQNNINDIDIDDIDDVDDADDDDENINKYMKMISKRKNSDISVNKSPSFLSRLKDDNDLNEFNDNYLSQKNKNNNNINDNDNKEEEKRHQPMDELLNMTKSRQENIVRHHRRKKKPKKFKRQGRKNRKLPKITRRKPHKKHRSSDDDISESHSDSQPNDK